MPWWRGAGEWEGQSNIKYIGVVESFVYHKHSENIVQNSV